MYGNKLALCVKVNGSVLRESGDTVALPFGSEFAVGIKNLNSVRVQAKVSIDGEDVAGTLVIGPNQSLDLERYIRNGNLSSGNRFKFIARSAAIEKHRGIKSEDGLVRVEYQFEKPAPEVVERVFHDRHVPYYDPWPYHRWWYYDYPWRGPIVYNGTTTFTKSSIPSGTSGSILRCAAMNATTPTAFVGAMAHNPGITVPGSISNQKFVSVSSFPLETQSHVLVLKLVGQVGSKAVKAAVTVKSKSSCATCGKKHKSGTKFCGGCGTALELI